MTEVQLQDSDLISIAGGESYVFNVVLPDGRNLEVMVPNDSCFDYIYDQVNDPCGLNLVFGGHYS